MGPPFQAVSLSERPPTLNRMSTDIYLVRHGQTYGNIEQRWCGHSETALTSLGIAQAQAAGRRLASIGLTAALSSDLSRAADTARHALNGRAIDHALDAGLREMHYGDWEDLPGADVEKQNPERLREFFFCRTSAPNGETIAALRQRTSASFWRAVELHRGGKVLMVSHGNAMMALVAELLKLPLEATWCFQFENASITKLNVSRSGRLTVHSVNDAGHLESLAPGTPPDFLAS